MITAYGFRTYVINGANDVRYIEGGGVHKGSQVVKTLSISTEGPRVGGGCGQNRSKTNILAENRLIPRHNVCSEWCIRELWITGSLRRDTF